jgi:anaerobic ribonucleoside-triphosphate reductase activating protein
MTDADNLRLGHSLAEIHAVLHNGPGWRVALWTQGCNLRCTARCLSPHLLDPRGGWEFTVSDVFEAVARAARASPEPVEGVTILGGEPTDQIEAVTSLLRRVRAIGLSTMVYTGHTMESLLARHPEAGPELLRQTDLLKEGPFVPGLASDTIAWRGSTNQLLRCVTGRYTPECLERSFQSKGKAFSVLLLADGTVAVSGLQTRSEAAAVEELARARRGGPGGGDGQEVRDG